MRRCIWCLKQNQDAAVEHIIPEALWCPDELVLTGGVVCKSCNNGLGHLDQAVSADLDFIAFQAGIRRKKGRPPAIDSRGNVRGTLEPSGPTLTFNMDHAPVTAHDGSTLGGYRGRGRNVRAKLQRHDKLAEVTFDVPFGGTDKFVRGIVKIGFSLLAFRVGADQVLDAHFDAVRHFVRGGEGVRHIVVSTDEDARYRHQVTPFTFRESGEHAMAFRLGLPEFLIEFSPEDRFPDLVMLAQESRRGRWTVLPMK